VKEKARKKKENNLKGEKEEKRHGRHEGKP